ncbi:uncharacterized protein LOC108488280 [Gossypium arboreum]|uniref:uncharacterized protein LOC108488280 n=1 Tax=Gossypium arboreum TaxID=29729 RepID=UPI000819398E|nr:uncharacterized protein LOC108488280 [Gossypium arboreum]
MGVVKFDDAPGVGNLLPNHTDNRVNTIVENMGSRIKLNVAEVKTLLREVRNYCEFYNEGDHEIERCNEFRALVQGQMDNKELEFFKFTKEENVCTLEEGSMEKKPVAFSYKDSKRVSWNYNCNVTSSGEGSPVITPNTKAEPVKGKSLVIEQGKVKQELSINEPVMEKEAKKFLKFLKHSEYSVVEQLLKQLTRILVLTLLLNSVVHCNALMKVLNETYAADDILVNKLDCLISNISADNFISFSDDEIPPGGMGSTKALHITTQCKGYTLPGVLIDNGSTLNVFPLSTLNRLPIDSSHMKTCQNIVREFDGTERKVMRRIEVPLLIGPNTYEVDFVVMDITPSYNCLLERPWIYLAWVVPSSLHQKLKLVTEGRLIKKNTEEDIIASVTSDAPYIENDSEVIECSFRSLKFVNATFIIEGGRVPIPKIFKATRMSLQLTVGKWALLGRELEKYLHGRVEVLALADKQDRFGLGYRPDAKQKRQEMIKRSLVINDMNDAVTDLEFPFERDMCLDGSQDFKDDRDCNLPPNLFRMAEQEEKHILTHKEIIKNVTLEEGKEVNIGTCITKETRRDLIKLLQEFKYIFA